MLVRNAMFRRVELAALRRYVRRSASSTARPGWDAEAWAEAMDGYFDEYAELGTGADARGPALFVVTEEPGPDVAVRQIFDDPDGHHDWGIRATSTSPRATRPARRCCACWTWDLPPLRRDRQARRYSSDPQDLVKMWVG